MSNDSAIYSFFGMRTIDDAAGAAPLDPEASVGRRVAIIDDDASVRRVISKIIARHGNEVHEYAGAGAFLDTIEHSGAGHVDLVLTDAIMPRMDGWELVRRLGECQPQLRVLMLTGFDPDAKPQTDHHNLVGTIRKPVEAKELVERLDAALRHSPGASGPRAGRDRPDGSH